MADVKIAYGTETTFTCSLASLASSATAGRESTVVDNGTDKWMDAMVMLKVALGAGTIANDRAVHVFAYGTVDTAGPTYPDAVTGADAAITMNDPTQLKLLGSVFTPTQSLTYKGGPWSVASLFGGMLPKKWGIVVRNYSGIALSSTEGNHAKLWIPVYNTVT